MLDLQFDHLVDFYEDEAGLGERVCAFVAEGLERGEAVIVIPTRGHRELIVHGLANRGVDVAGARSSGALVERDAEVLLNTFLDGQALDLGHFDKVVGELVRSVESFMGVRIVGEMVDLLWKRNDVIDALALETAWNRLGEERSFALYCCYSAGGQRGDDSALAHVRDLHSGVVFAPRHANWAAHRGVKGFPPLPDAPRAVRSFVSDLLMQWDLEDHIDVVNLVVSELSTNAVRHADSPFEVILSRRGPVLRVVVQDESRKLPALRDPSVAQQGGRGLGIVAHLARGWGAEVTPSGKIVWADLVIKSSTESFGIWDAGVERLASIGRAPSPIVP